MEGTFVACRPVQYGPNFPADMIDMHQVFEMKNEQNDEALLRLRFVAPLQPGARLLTCGPCGRKFTDEFSLNRHGKLRHEPKRGPEIRDDHLGKIDTNDPDQLIERADQLRREMRTTNVADGYNSPNPDAEADRAAADEQKFLDEVAPIDYTKTKAAMKADDVKVPAVSAVRTKKAAPKRAKKRGA